MKVKPIESTTLDYLSYHSGRACSEEPVRKLESLVNEMSEALEDMGSYRDKVGNAVASAMAGVALDTLKKLDKYNRGE